MLNITSSNVYYRNQYDKTYHKAYVLPFIWNFSAAYTFELYGYQVIIKGMGVKKHNYYHSVSRRSSVCRLLTTCNVKTLYACGYLQVMANIKALVMCYSLFNQASLKSEREHHIHNIHFWKVNEKMRNSTPSCPTFRNHRKSSPTGLTLVTFSNVALNCNPNF